ncbi:IMPACT family protein [Collinsella tanakaei]|uniref:IMPACT family protein n=1 Tax=Collinsella tanakaei TaxID=626935 RepID=UPI003F50474A
MDRKSRFIAQLVHVESEEEASAHQAAVRAKHYDARHNVPAWILVDGRERASDDGEPQRTSGLPTLEVLRGAGLKNVCCVTTRYFGGTLLGPGGLVRAYTAAAQAVVENARAEGLLVEMTSVVPVEVRVAYPQYEQVLHVAQNAGAHVAGTDFTDSVLMHLVFRAGEEAAFTAAMTELMAGRENVEVGNARFAEF